jgi:hypothetical protein
MLVSVTSLGSVQLCGLLSSSCPAIHRAPHNKNALGALLPSWHRRHPAFLFCLRLWGSSIGASHLLSAAEALCVHSRLLPRRLEVPPCVVCVLTVPGLHLVCRGPLPCLIEKGAPPG